MNQPLPYGYYYGNEADQYTFYRLPKALFTNSRYKDLSAVLKRTARECYGKIRRRGEREVNFSELTARELASLAVTDEYFTDEYVFSVLGESVGVSDIDLAEALNDLPADRRDIVLMSYFFDMTDKEIAEKLNMARRTVAHKRTSSLRELKKSMESEE